MRRLSIKTKLFFIAILFILYPTIIIGYFGYENYANVMKKNAIANSQSTARDLTKLISERMEKLNLFAIQIFYDGTINETNNEFNSNNYDYITVNTFQQYLQHLLFSKNELSEILIKFTENGKSFEANRTLLDTTGSFSNYEALRKSALSGNGRPVWYIESQNGKLKGIYLTKIIYSTLNINKDIGLMALKIDEKYILEVFNNLMNSSKQNIGLYSGDGQPIFLDKTFKLEDKQAIKDFIISNKATQVAEIPANGDTAYMIYDTIQPANWKLVIGISGNVMYSEVRRVAKVSIFLCLATLPICILLIDYLYNNIIRPMNVLIKKMNQVEIGNFGVTIESDRQDEFGYVYRTFNKMSENIKNLIDTVYKEQIAMKEAEIKALQAQINPHFLYNTLEAINWKAKIKGNDEVSDMVSALSYIIEANLNRSNEKFIPVYKEIEYLESYKFLIQKRFGEKIKFVMNIDKEAEKSLIPKLLVQPIVENTIYHGLEMKKGGGTVEIEIKKVDAELYITVFDDGLGIEAIKLKALRESLEFDAEDNVRAEDGKIGVINVHRRIRLLYGKDYGLKIYSHQGEGTTVTMKVPANI